MFQFVHTFYLLLYMYYLYDNVLDKETFKSQRHLRQTEIYLVNLILKSVR
jgi:hypothetical protein